MPFLNLYYLIYNRQIHKTIVLYNIGMGIISVSLFVEIMDSVKNYQEVRIMPITV